MANQCKYVDASGEQCKAYEAKGTGYCAGHARQLGLLVVEKKKSAPRIEVGEPGPLDGLRKLTEEFEAGAEIDPELATKLANLLRPYLGLAPLDGVQLAGEIDARRAADEQVAESEAAQRRLIERSLALVDEHPSRDKVERVNARVARDVQSATSRYRAKIIETREALLREEQVEVSGIGQEEMYMLNGVRVVIPALGRYRVPKSIAQLHNQRLIGVRELEARSRLMSSVPEYNEVRSGMAAIDSAFGTRSQLGGPADVEVNDFLVAEEIK